MPRQCLLWELSQFTFENLAREQLIWHNKFAVIIDQWNSDSNVEICNVVAMTIEINMIQATE